MQEVARHPELYQNPPTPVAICVPAHGQLQCRHVIFIPMNSTFGNLIPRAMSEMLNSAIQCGAQSLAFPAIGTGKLNVLDFVIFKFRRLPTFGSLWILSSFVGCASVSPKLWYFASKYMFPRTFNIPHFSA
jgi:hypothetical protein